MAVPEAPPGRQHPQTASQGGMMVPTQQGPQDQMQGSSGGEQLSDVTKDEQKAGKEAMQKAQERKQKEQEMGQKLMQQKGGGDQQKMRSQEVRGQQGQQS